MLDLQSQPLPRVRGASRPQWFVEMLLLSVFYGAYAWIRNAHGKAAETPSAFAHGRKVMDLGRALHLDPERSLQARLPLDGPVVHLLNGFYLLAHVTVTLSTLIFLFIRRPELYRRCRTVLVAVTALALIVFAVYPTAPPRLLPGSGMRDILSVGGWWSFNNGGIERIADPYAAMPSLHLAWSTWVALSLALALGRDRLRWLFGLYPLLVTLLVLTNGSHWLLDTVAGGSLTLVSWWVIPTLSLKQSWRWQRASYQGGDDDHAVPQAVGYRAEP